MKRRHFVSALMSPAVFGQVAAPPKRKGRIKQGITRGVFGRDANIEDCCREAAKLGIRGFDLIGPTDWPTLKKYGLVPSMYPGSPAGPGGPIPGAPDKNTNHRSV